MSATVLLKDIVDALEMQFDEASSFLDLETGRIETVSSDLLSKADESAGKEPDLPDWQRQEWEVVKLIVSTDRFQQLPAASDDVRRSRVVDYAELLAFGGVRQHSPRSAERYSRRRCIPAFQGSPSATPHRVGLV